LNIRIDVRSEFLLLPMSFACHTQIQGSTQHIVAQPLMWKSKVACSASSGKEQLLTPVRAGGKAETAHYTSCRYLFVPWDL